MGTSSTKNHGGYRRCRYAARMRYEELCDITVF